jgi:hypothetical protein
MEILIKIIVTIDMKYRLDTNAATNPFIETGGFKSLAYSWYLYRIPLKEFSSTIGSPSFSDVESIRMFVQGVDSMVHFPNH